MAHRAVHPPNVFRVAAPTSLATLTDGRRVIHISGQIPVDSSGHLVGRDDVAAQTAQVLENIRALVEAEGGTIGDVCRLTIYLLKREDLPSVMEARRLVFAEPHPATTVVIVAGLVNPDWLVEIEGTAALSSS